VRSARFPCTKGHVLVVDDLPDVCTTLSGLLSDEGYDVRSASSRAEALQMVDAERFHVAVLDVRLDEADEENQDGLLLMHDIREKDPTVAIIILTGYATVRMVQDALQPNREGISLAFGFLQKSEVGQLPEYVKRALEHRASSATRTIHELIAQGENERVEFKSSIRWDYNKRSVNKKLQEIVAAAIAGMLNSEGGTLLIGVADDGTVLGIEEDVQTLRKRNPDGFQLALTDIVRDYVGIECMGCIRTRIELLDDKHVCIVSIKKSPTPVFLATGDTHKFWVRTGNSTRSLDVKAAIDYIQMHWRESG
jgi:CheY-like chemotaxis protein